MFIALLDHPSRAEILGDDQATTLVKGIMAGSLCPSSVMKRCRDVLGINDG
jgi:hypothetical protein